jgi:hypothetical protein
MDSGVVTNLAEQWPLAAFIVIVIIWLLTRQDKLTKLAIERQDKLTYEEDERRARERQFQATEAEKQRLWNEEQGLKRDQFQRELITHTNRFIKGLQEDQQKSINLLNESIQLVSSKTDLILHSLNQHHSYTEKQINEISKWRDGLAIRRRGDA